MHWAILARLAPPEGSTSYLTLFSDISYFSRIIIRFGYLALPIHTRATCGADSSRRYFTISRRESQFSVQRSRSVGVQSGRCKGIRFPESRASVARNACCGFAKTMHGVVGVNLHDWGEVGSMNTVHAKWCFCPTCSRGAESSPAAACVVARWCGDGERRSGRVVFPPPRIARGRAASPFVACRTSAARGVQDQHKISIRPTPRQVRMTRFGRMLDSGYWMAQKKPVLPDGSDCA